MRIVYTAIFGEYDELKQPLVKSEGVKFICFSDMPLRGGVWEVVQMPIKWDAVRMARWCKITFPYSGKWSQALWIDANQQINCDVNKIFSRVKQFDFALLKHPWRSSVKFEAEECIKLKKDSEIIIRMQMACYKSDGYEFDNTLVATGLMVRRDVGWVKNFCDQWFKEILDFSYRDQLSFNYVQWKLCQDGFGLMPWEELTGNFIRWKHKK